MSSTKVPVVMDAFSFPFPIGGGTIMIQVPAGVTGTATLPPPVVAPTAPTIDSSVTIDSPTGIDQ